MEPLENYSESRSLKTTLREAGLRATAPRIAVLRVLQEALSPLSHAEVATELTSGAWDRATIYRNLVDMADAGIIRRAEVDHVWRFEVIPEGSDPNHPHFVCIKCGVVLCLYNVELSVSKPRRVPRTVRKQQVEVQLRGICDRCL